MLRAKNGVAFSSPRMPPKAKAAESFPHGTVCLAKMKGHPAWPAQTVDPSTISAEARKAKPKGKDHIVVQFFPQGE